MSIIELGYNQQLASYRSEEKLDSFDVGRVISEHKDRYIVKAEKEEFESELIGNLRFTAENRADLPAVGDWVAISEYDTGKALIHAIYPRYTTIERQAVGKSGQKQIIATNVDFGIIVQAVNRDFNINRLERYLTICYESGIDPIILISKIDLIEPEILADLISSISNRIKNAPIIPISNINNEGLKELTSLIEQGKTYCLLGSSGVGKSTLINNLSGETKMSTGEISESIDRGKHVTSHRELILLKSGGILIDNPGMREVGITSVASGIEITFDEIYELAEYCKFKDCTHTNESGCAILEAMESGDLDTAEYDNFQKLQREKEHYESTVVEKRKKDKDLGKMIKSVMKIKKQRKF